MFLYLRRDAMTAKCVGLGDLSSLGFQSFWWHWKPVSQSRAAVDVLVAVDVFVY